eukprot:9132272-Karenia_brevis.AAC.1
MLVLFEPQWQQLWAFLQKMGAFDEEKMSSILDFVAAGDLRAALEPLSAAFAASAKSWLDAFFTAHP